MKKRLEREPYHSSTGELRKSIVKPIEREHKYLIYKLPEYWLNQLTPDRAYDIRQAYIHAGKADEKPNILNFGQRTEGGRQLYFQSIIPILRSGEPDSTRSSGEVLLSEVQYRTLSTSAGENGFLEPNQVGSIRIRETTTENGTKYTETVKGKGVAIRTEVESAIDQSQWEQLLPFTGSKIVKKTRYKVPWGGKVLEIDIYPQGEMIMEIEYPTDREFRNPTIPFYPGNCGKVTYYDDWKNKNIAMYGFPIHPAPDHPTTEPNQFERYIITPEGKVVVR